MYLGSDGFLNIFELGLEFVEIDIDWDWYEVVKSDDLYHIRDINGSHENFRAARKTKITQEVVPDRAH